MNKFSCRFECSHDYTQLIIAASKVNVDVQTIELYHVRPTGWDHTLPDIHVEFCASGGTEEVLDIMRSVDDLHVGIQTLKQCPLKDNPLERDHSIS